MGSRNTVTLFVLGSTESIKSLAKCPCTRLNFILAVTGNALNRSTEAEGLYPINYVNKSFRIICRQVQIDGRSSTFWKMVEQDFRRPVYLKLSLLFRMSNNRPILFISDARRMKHIKKVTIFCIVLLTTTYLLTTDANLIEDVMIACIDSVKHLHFLAIIN